MRTILTLYWPAGYDGEECGAELVPSPHRSGDNYRMGGGICKEPLTDSPIHKIWCI